MNANEPDTVGSTSDQETSAAAAAQDTEEKRQEVNLDDLTTDELLAMTRAAEARANVFRGLAKGDESHQPALDAAQADLQKYSDALKDHNMDTSGAVIDPTLTVLDKEGTSPTMADATGTFAADAETANIGGIGINDSNADPEGALEKLKEAGEAGQEMDVRGTSPLMARSTSKSARAKADEKKKVRREPL